MLVRLNSDGFRKFLASIKNVFRGGITFTLFNNRVEVITMSQDKASILFFGVIPCETVGVTESVVLHIKDISKMERLLDFNGDKPTFEFKVEEDHLYYENSDIRGAKFMLASAPARREETIIKRSWFKVKNPMFECGLTSNDIKKVLQSISFATDSRKLYLYEEDDTLVAELNDEEQSAIDSVKLNLSKIFKGSFSGKYIVLIDSLNCLPINREVQLTMQIIPNELPSRTQQLLFFTVQEGEMFYRYLFNPVIR